VYLTLAATVGFFSARAFPAGPLWEYDFRRLEKPKDLSELAEMGEAGWEVAGTFTHWNGQQTVLLKRKR